MSYTSSGGISFSGIGSGTDFSEVVDQLLELESKRLYGLEDSREVAMESYEAMSDLISSVSESKEALSLLNDPSKFLLKLGASSLETVATATADSNAVDGNFTVHVDQLASNAIWASTQTFGSKTTSINNSGATTDLVYTYKGETHSISVPANTTLEGLAYMINNDKTNPGVKMQIIKTADGYTFQMSGTESGESANLQIQPNANLVGFGGTGSGPLESTWESFGAVDASAQLNAGQGTKTYSYDITLLDGTTDFNVTVENDITQQGLVDAINAQYQSTTSTSGEIASLENGQMVIKNVSNVTTSVDGTETENQNTTMVGSGTWGGDLSSSVSPMEYFFELQNGTTFSVTAGADESIEDFFQRVETEANNLGGTVDISLTSDGTTTDINFSGLASGMDAFALSDYNAPQYQYSTAANAADVALDSSLIPDPVTFNVLLDGQTSPTQITLSNKATYEDLRAELEGLGLTASFENIDASDASLGQKLVVEGASSIVSTSAAYNTNTNFGGRVTSSDGWTIQEAQNAIFRIDNFAHTLTSSTNSVTDVIEGVTLTLKSTGSTQIGIASDLDSVRANIQTVLDSINSVLLKIKDLTSVTEEPSTTYTEEGTVTAAALTGEYSVQSFQSRFKSAITGSPPGFNTIVDAADIFGGDFVATLSQMGIKTVSDADDPNFGLFAIAPDGMIEEMQAFDQKLFDDALANNIQDVINFFAADDSGSTSSNDFGYANHIAGITEPGTYDVSYNVDAAGNTTVEIGGYTASPSDVNPNTYTVSSGPAAGLSITLYDLSEGPHTGTVSVQRGLVPHLEDFFAKEMKFSKPDPDDPSIAQDNGGLMTAQYGFEQLIDSIDAQMTTEMERLDRWEYNERMKYARLDTLLGEYNNQMSNLTTQLGQLG